MQNLNEQLCHICRHGANNCKTDGGHCYMFKTIPDYYPCGQFNPVWSKKGEQDAHSS